MYICTYDIPRVLYSALLYKEGKNIFGVSNWCNYRGRDTRTSNPHAGIDWKLDHLGTLAGDTEHRDGNLEEYGRLIRRCLRIRVGWLDRSACGYVGTVYDSI